MSRHLLIFRSLSHYWRTHVAVVVGVAAAVAVLAGALLVGDSVRGTLRDLALRRLGATSVVVTSNRFFREALADDVRADLVARTGYRDAVPLAVMPGMVTAQTSGRRAGNVFVYGVDDRFWRFHGVSGAAGPADREAFVSAALAGETGLQLNDAALVRIERPSAVPLESLHGRRDEVGRRLRLTVTRVLGPDELGEFALSPRQGDVLAVFVPLRRLQEELEVGAGANALLVSAERGAAAPPLGPLEILIRDRVALEDVGLRLRTLDARRAIAVEAEGALLEEADVAAVNAALDSTLLAAQPIFTYLANGIQVGARSVPYSLVTAVDLQTIGVNVSAGGPAAPPPLVLNDWAAKDLSARVGDNVRLEYYVWEEPGRLVTRTADLRVAGIVPTRAIDQDLAPLFKGISDSPTLDSWDPPFPIDLKRIRPEDEAYWKTYRTTPKAFVPLEVGQRLWGSRHGMLTSIRIDALAGKDLGETARAFDERLRSKIDPFALGMSATDVTRSATAAASGTTDFGEYFLYFSTFIVVAALVLAALFFKLGVEQRVREVGLLLAVGIDPRTVRQLFAGEAALIAVAGSLLGVTGAVAYAWLVVAGLGTWWVDAVGTRALEVHVSARSLAIGAIGGFLAAVGCTIWTLRRVASVSARGLLAGEVEAPESRSHSAARSHLWIGIVLALAAVGLAASGAAGAVDPAGAFFGAGALLLSALLFGCAFIYRLTPRHVVHGRGWRPLAHLGMRNSRFRPGRSVLSIGVIAAATFILIAVDAFRRDRVTDTSRQSGVGGYSLLVETLLPIANDLGSEESRRDLNVEGLAGAAIAPFRLRPGDDASCLNLYVPQTPRILGARADFIAAGRFAFQASAAATDADRANPWRLLDTTLADEAVPVVADANSLAYVLHRAIGEDIVMKAGDRQIRLRVVGALRDSLFQSELVMSETNFRSLFPDEEGYRVWLIEAAADRAPALAVDLENALADYGADVTSTSARLASFHRVENAYLSTFQTLGGLGLVIGTIGLAAVLLRNVFERRRELALLGAVGYRQQHFVIMLVAESLSWLVGGVLVGAASAAVAILPALIERGGRLPFTTSGALVVFAVLTAGLVSTVIAARLATREPLLSALRSE